MTSLSGAHVTITGGSEGIGLATAEAALAKGARVSLLSRSTAKLDAARERLGGAAAVSAADVADESRVVEAIGELVDARGPCDVLVCSAGFAVPGYFTELPTEVFRRQVDVNYLGTVHAVRAVTPSMVERGRGHLVLVSSAAGLMGVFGYSAYSPTKFALRGLGETLRAELAPHGVRVGIVYPPDTLTPGFDEENLHKPPETARISAAITPKPAASVAAAIVAGIERDRLTITADPLTAVLARAAGVLGPVSRRMMDRDVRSVQRARRGGST